MSIELAATGISEWMLHAAAAAPLFWSARTAPWRTLADGAKQNIWFGAIALLAVLSTLAPPAVAHLNLQSSGAGVLTLVLGPQLALIALVIVSAIKAFIVGIDNAQTFAADILASAVLPAAVAACFARTVARTMPANPFGFLFGAGFFGTAVASAAATLAAAGALSSEIMVLTLLHAFAEAGMTCAILTLMIVTATGKVAMLDEATQALFARPSTAAERVKVVMRDGTSARGNRLPRL